MISRLNVDIRIPTVLISLILSLWAVWSAGTINNDGVIYVATANLLQQGDLDGAYHLYNWPFYSWLIAITGKFSGLGLETSAQIVNAAFSATLAFVFLTLIRDFGADRKTLLFAAFVILFHPYINDSREEIIRDHGYWALYLISVLFLFRYYRNPTWKHSIAWGGAMAAATLFRIEGLIFLLLLPMVLPVLPGHRRISRAGLFVRANIVLLVLVALLATIMLLQPDFYTHWAGRLQEPEKYVYMLWKNLATGLQQKADVVRSRVLSPWSEEYSMPVIYSALVVIVADKIIRTLTPLYCALPFFPKLRARFNPPVGTIPIMVWLVVLNMSAVSVFLINEFFISSRYILPLVLILLILMPFSLASLHDQWLNRRNLPPVWKGIFPVTIVLLVFMTGDGLIAWKGSSRIYLREAGEWIKDNIPADARLYTNNQMVRYYSGRAITERDASNKKSDFSWLQDSDWKRSTYLAIAINRHALPNDAKRVESIDAKVLKVFRNRRNEQVILLQRPEGNQPEPAPLR